MSGRPSSEVRSSPKVAVEALPLEAAELSQDGLEVMLRCGPLAEGFLHLIDLGSVRTLDGKPLMGDRAWYHVIKAPR